MTTEDLDKLKKRLYDKKEDFAGRRERGEIHSENGKVETFWKNGEGDESNFGQIIGSVKKRKKFTILKTGLVIFFLVAVGMLVYFFLNGDNVVTSRKIDLELEGPSMVKSGEQNTWHISITNNNEASLELADLIIDYPEKSLSLLGSKLLQERRSLGKIFPGETLEEELSIFILGDEEEEREMKVTLEYRSEGSNAIFAKEVKQEIQLSNSPVGVSLELPKDTESGQQVTVKVEYVSNSNTVLKDVYLKMIYPPGFNFVNSNFETFSGNNLWGVGDLNPQEKRVLEITGTLEGQDLSELSFNAFLGFRDEFGNFESFGSDTETVALKRSFLNFGFLINNKETDVVYSDGTYTIKVPWTNNLPIEIYDTSIYVKVLGEAVDLRTLLVNGGFYRGYDNTIVWNSSSKPELSLLAPGQTGSVDFTFSLKDFFPVQVASDKNFTVELAAEMTGFRSGGDGQGTPVKTVTEKQIKIASRVQVDSDVSFVSGALPPKVGEESVYKITWSVTNFYNDITDVVLRASIPSYMSWIGVQGLGGEDITYSPASGEIVWKVDKIESAAGILKPIKEISFNVALNSAVNQIGGFPDLISDATLTAKDSFTGLNLQGLVSAVNTNSIEEVKSNSALGRVVE